MKDFLDILKNVSSEYKAKPFWSLNGKLEKEELLRQIDDMQEMGFGGAFLHSRTGLETEYLSDEWFYLIEKCVDKLSKKGMEAWLYDEDRWPSGTCGGLVARKKRNRLKSIICEEVLPENYKKPAHFIGLFSAEIKSGTIYKYKKINDINELEKGQTLLVFSWAHMEPMAFYNGFTYIDTLNKSAVEEFLKLTHERYKQKMGERFGLDIKGIFQDEVNRGPLLNGFVVGDDKRLLRIPYTYKLFRTFKKHKNYDLRDFLPLLYYKNGEDNFSTVTYDYTQVVMQMLLENFTIPYYNWCKENGLKSTGHVLHEDSLACQTTMLGSVMQYYEYMDYPGVDNLGTQNYRYEVPKLASSISKQFSKKFTLSEMYGCSGWQMNLNDYKHDGDWQAFMGINFRCPHLSWYTMKGEAKRDCPASIMSQSAWYKEYSVVENYFSALNACLNAGKDMVENLIINPIESSWGLSRLGVYVNAFGVADETYKDLEKKYTELFEGLQKRGIDADFGDEEHIAKYGRIENGLFYIANKGYKRVLVSNLITIRESTLKLLNDFVSLGGEVLFISRYPEYLNGKKTEKQKFEGHVLLPFDIDIIADIVKETECPVSVFPSGSGVFVRKRKTENGMIFAFLNSSKDEGKSVTIKIATQDNLVKVNLRELKLENVEFKEEKGFAYINYDFDAGEELVLIENENLVAQKETIEEKLIDVTCNKFKYDLSEENYLVLDRVRLYAGDKWDEEEFILNKDIKLRQKHGIELRFGEMIQPWFKQKFFSEKWHKSYGKYQIEYKFSVLEVIQEPIYLMMEDADRFKVFINGKKFVPAEFIQSNIDICFKKYLINKDFIKIGTNKIVLEFDFSDSLNLEAIYLCGKFAVKKDGGLYNLPEEIPIGDISDFGLPYYSGKLTYFIPVEKGEYKLKFKEIDCATVVFDGENISFLPYESTYHYAENKLAITYIFNRKNLFGNNLTTENGIVRDLQKQGMLRVPYIYKKL